MLGLISIAKAQVHLDCIIVVQPSYTPVIGLPYSIDVRTPRSSCNSIIKALVKYMSEIMKMQMLGPFC